MSQYIVTLTKIRLVDIYILLMWTSFIYIYIFIWWAIRIYNVNPLVGICIGCEYAYTRTGTYGPGRASLSVCIGLHLILYSIHRTATDRRWAMSHSHTPPVMNRAPLTARSNSLRCIRAAEHHTAEQYSKTGRTKPQKHLSRSDLSRNTRQDFLKIPNLWEAALETKRRCVSKVILESNVTPNITRSSDSFSTVPPIVNGDALCVTWSLSVIVLSHYQW